MRTAVLKPTWADAPAAATTAAPAVAAAPCADLPPGWFAAIASSAALAFIATELPRALFIDHCFFMSVAREMTEGRMPYRDLINGNYPGAFLLHYAIYLAFGDCHWGVRAADGILLMCTVVCLSRMFASSLSRTAILAAAVMWIAQYAGANDTDQAQRDSMCIPFLVAGVWAAQRSIGRWRAAFWMGLCLSIAIWIKPTFVFTGVTAEMFVLYYLVRDHGRRAGGAVLGQMAWAWAGTLAVSVPILIWILSIASFDTLWDQLVTSLVGYGCTTAIPDPWWMKCTYVAWLLGLPALMIPAGLAAVLAPGGMRRYWPVAALLVSTGLGMQVQMGASYQRLPLLFSLGLLAAVGLHHLAGFGAAPAQRPPKWTAAWSWATTAPATAATGQRRVLRWIAAWSVFAVILALLNRSASMHSAIRLHLPQITQIALAAAVGGCALAARRWRRLRTLPLFAILMIGWPAAALLAKSTDDVHTMWAKGLAGYRQHRSRGYADVSIGEAIRDATRPDDHIALLGVQSVIHWAARRHSAVRDSHWITMYMDDREALVEPWRQQYYDQLVADPPVVFGAERTLRREWRMRFPSWPDDLLAALLTTPQRRLWFEEHYELTGRCLTRGANVSHPLTLYVRRDRPDVRQRLLADPRMQAAARRLEDYRAANQSTE